MSGDAVAGRPRPEACGRRTNYLAAAALDPIDDANAINVISVKQGADRFQRSEDIEGEARALPASSTNRVVA